MLGKEMKGMICTDTIPKCVILMKRLIGKERLWDFQNEENVFICIVWKGYGAA